MDFYLTIYCWRSKQLEIGVALSSYFLIAPLYSQKRYQTDNDPNWSRLNSSFQSWSHLKNLCPASPQNLRSSTSLENSATTTIPLPLLTFHQNQSPQLLHLDRDLHHDYSLVKLHINFNQPTKWGIQLHYLLRTLVLLPQVPPSNLWTFVHKLLCSCQNLADFIIRRRIIHLPV